MEPFSKLRPPDTIRIKVRLAEWAMADTQSINSNLSTMTTASTSSCANNSNSSLNEAFNHNSKKFCVEPQITSYEILLDLIRDSFSLKE
jgi:hypothetical protein